MSGPICFFTGSKSAFNVLFDTLNFGWMLHEEFELDLVTTRPEDFGDEGKDYFDLYSYDQSNTRRGEAKALYTYLQNNSPQTVVNVVEPSIQGLIAGPIARRHGVPFTYRYSGDLFDLYRVSHGWRKPAQFGINNVFGRIPLALASRCIALGPTGKKRLVNRGKDPEDVVILPPPIDATRFQEDTQEPDWDVPDDRKVMLFAGRRSKIKGIDDLEVAIPKILEQRDDLQFVFVGSHGKYPDVPSQYKGHITLVGRVPLGGMPKYFRAADLLILPTYNEGLPRVITESLASGTPVAARDVADIAYTTENTFDELREFIHMVLNFESLPLDDVTPFTRETLKPQHIDFFNAFISNNR